MKEKLIEWKIQWEGPVNQMGIQEEERIKKSSMWWDNSWEFLKTVERYECSNSGKAVKSGQRYLNIFVLTLYNSKHIKY